MTSVVDSLPGAIVAMREQIESQLLQHLQASSDDTRLRQAMVYSTTNGGKRIRGVLTLLFGEMLFRDVNTEVPRNAILDCAVAIELVHAYSLIHDDLPAMDDDDLRRGKPTCHVQFDEATAILAGDALQTLAFNVLATTQAPAAALLECIRLLSQCAGVAGMCGGQAKDLENTQRRVDESELQTIHRSKTGALINATVQLPMAIYQSVSALPLPAELRHDLLSITEMLGLAFQIQDDIIDVTSTTEIMGKPQGSDLQQYKNSYVTLLGLDGARSKYMDLNTQLWKTVEGLPYNTEALQSLLVFLTNRNH